MKDLTMPKIAPQPGILDIALYVSGESRIAGREDVLKLSSNENPFGPSPAALEAARETAAEMHRYPPVDHAELRAAIGAVHGLDADRIICGVGSDEVFIWLAQAYAGAGDEVLITEHGFSMYPIVARGVGAVPVTVPERDRRVDVEAVLAGVTERTRIVFIANPGNPSGTMIGAEETRRLADGLPEDVILVLDGAYSEFADLDDGAAALATERGNVVMTRTFSKAYGLGGLRIGWGYADREIIDTMNRIRAPFNLSNVQLAAGVAAVRDRPFLEGYVAGNARRRADLAARLAGLGIVSDPSHANFILARFGDAGEADAADRHLKGAGIIVRKTGGYGLPECLRITVGDEAGCDRVVAALTEFKAGR